MFVTNWISPTKIQKISEITNFFRHYFLSRTEVNMQEYGIKIEEINKANVDVHLVYTIKGPQSMEFIQMLTTLYECIF